MLLLKKIKKYLLLEAAVSLGMGLCLLLLPRTTMKTILYITAAYLLVRGIFNLVSYFRNRAAFSLVNGLLISGIVQVVFSVVLFRFPMSVAVLLPIALGLSVMIGSTLHMAYALDIRREFGKGWVPVLLYGLLTAVAGLLLVINPMSGIVVFTVACGVLLLLKAAGDVGIYFVLRRLGRLEP